METPEDFFDQVLAALPEQMPEAEKFATILAWRAYEVAPEVIGPLSQRLSSIPTMADNYNDCGTCQEGMQGMIANLKQLLED